MCVFQLQKKQGQASNTNKPVARTMEALGVSEKTVTVVTKKLEKGEPFPDKEEKNRGMTVPDEHIAVVWKTLMEMYHQKEHVTINSLFSKLNKRINTRNTGWTWGRTTLYRFLTTKMGYSYTTRKTYYKQLKENVANALQRVKYIQQIQLYRNEGKEIFYQDETWLNKNMMPMKAWVDENRDSGQKTPQGKGERSIVCHVGSKKGFVESA